MRSYKQWKRSRRHTSTTCRPLWSRMSVPHSHLIGSSLLTTRLASDPTREDLWVLQDHFPQVAEAPEREQVESDADEFTCHGESVLRPPFLEGTRTHPSRRALYAHVVPLLDL